MNIEKVLSELAVLYPEITPKSTIVEQLLELEKRLVNTLSLVGDQRVSHDPRMPGPTTFEYLMVAVLQAWQMAPKTWTEWAHNEMTRRLGEPQEERPIPEFSPEERAQLDEIWRMARRQEAERDSKRKEGNKIYFNAKRKSAKIRGYRKAAGK